MDRQNLKKTPLTVLMTVAGLICACGCQSTDYTDIQAFVQAHNHDVVASTYRIEPPDVIRIESPIAPEIDGVVRQVNSDGTIALRLLGSVKVSTLTDKEVAAKLERLLGEYYVDPKVEVSVMRHSSRQIYVFGQVSAPGARRFTGRDTLMRVLADARPNLIAWKSKIKIIRPSAYPDEVHEIVVDVEEMMKKGDLRKNLLLQEGDIVYVPPTPVGWVGLRVRELLYPVDPIVSGYAYPARAMGAANAYDDLDTQNKYYGQNPGGGGVGQTGW